jgi:2-dehydropantoate 2-reductase
MKICVFGAGAIGGYLAAELALAGHEVSAIARGPHLEAMRDNGLRLIVGGKDRVARFPVSDDPADFGQQDYVICALKAHQAARSAPAMVPLLGPETAVVTAMNGVPWWYFHKAGGVHDGRPVRAVDPDCLQWTAIGPARAIGCVVDPACEVIAPGVIEHREFKRFILGEPDDSLSDRACRIAEALTSAGFDAPVRTGIRRNVWLKLWGNVCFNPISAITGATLDRISTDPALRALCTTMMQEARSVALAHGVDIPERMIDRRLDAAARATGHKMSMLQDLERGREMEIAALVTAVTELADLVGVATPTIDRVLAEVQERARQAGLTCH